MDSWLSSGWAMDAVALLARNPLVYSMTQWMNLNEIFDNDRSILVITDHISCKMPAVICDILSFSLSMDLLV